MTERIGRAVAWLLLLMTAVAAFNAVGRYLGRFLGVNLSSNAYIELQWYLFSVVFLVAAAYTLERDAHVRVDVLYGRLSSRARAWIDTVGTALLLIPFSMFVLWMSWPSVRNAWRIREQSPDPGGLPRYPIKAVILVGFALLLVQGVAELIKSIGRLRSPTTPEEVGTPRPPEGV
ncbi:MAG: TRAP transporter small permease subunit [Longimicrobiales bacterium]